MSSGQRASRIKLNTSVTFFRLFKPYWKQSSVDGHSRQSEFYEWPQIYPTNISPTKVERSKSRLHMVDAAVSQTRETRDRQLQFLRKLAISIIIYRELSCKLCSVAYTHSKGAISTLNWFFCMRQAQTILIYIFVLTCVRTWFVWLFNCSSREHSFPLI